MLRPSISVWGLTETALQKTGEGDEILVTSGLEQRPLAGLSELAVETVVKEWRVGAREEQVKELTKEAEVIVVGEGKELENDDVCRVELKLICRNENGKLLQNRTNSLHSILL